MDQKRHADEADEREDAAGDDGKQLLALNGKAKSRVDLRWGEQSKEMAAEQQQNADVEQDAAPHQLTSAKELTGLRAPSVLAAVEPRPAAEEIHHHAKVGIEPEEELVDVSWHGCSGGYRIFRLGCVALSAPR